MAGFSLYTRKRNNGKPVYYAQLKKQDGTYTTAKSTKCTRKRSAEKWCEDYLLKNGIPLPGQEITFEQFSKDFFSWTGQWATYRTSYPYWLSHE